MLSFFGHLIEQEIILENKIEFLAKQNKIPVEHVEKLAAADPNPKKKNLMWLVRQHKSNAISLDMHDGLHPDELHQHSQALRRLEDFHTKEPGEARKFFGDINQYKTVHDLNAKMDDYEENQKHIFDKNWGEKVFDHEGHQIYHASDELQASNHGKNTGWCTRIHGGNHQTQYLESGNLYVHYPPKAVKPGEKDHESDSEGRHQFFIPEDDSKPELQNHRNNPVHPIFHEANHPSLEKSEHWNKFKKAFENHHNEEEPEEETEEEIRHRLAHGSLYERCEAVENYGAHHEHDHLWSTEEHPLVHDSILDYADNTHDHGIDGEIHRTESDLAEPGYHFDVHHRIAGQTHYGSVAEKLSEHGDEDTLRELAKNKKWQRLRYSQDSLNDQDSAMNAAEKLGNHQSYEIRRNLIKNSSEVTLPTAAHAVLNNPHPVEHDEDLPTIYDYMAHKATKIFSDHHEEKQKIFHDLKTHSDDRARAAYAKYHPEEARQENSFKNDPSPHIQEALHWDNPDKLMHGSVEARRQAAKIGTDKHREILMNDPSSRVRSMVARHASNEHFAHMLGNEENNKPVIQKVTVQRLTDHSRDNHELHQVMASSDNPSVRKLAAQHGDYRIHRRLMNDPHYDVRRKVLYSSRDRHVANHISAHDPDEQLRNEASFRLRTYSYNFRDYPE